LYGCNALRLRAWEAPDLATARTLVEDYFAQLAERERRLGLAPETGREHRLGSTDPGPDAHTRDERTTIEDEAA
jgi:hypothetical protein